MALQNIHSSVSNNIEYSAQPTPLQNITNSINYKMNKALDAVSHLKNKKIDDAKKENEVLAQMVTARLIKMKNASAKKNFKQKIVNIIYE